MYINPFVEKFLLQTSVPQIQQELVEGKIWFNALIVMFLCCLYLLVSSKREDYWMSLKLIHCIENSTEKTESEKTPHEGNVIII